MHTLLSFFLSQRVYAVTVFLASFLLFSVQPLLSKYLLPFFGGSSGVWTVSLLFYMSVLFLGYLSTHLLSSRVSLRWQKWAYVAGAVGVVGVLLLGRAAWSAPVLPMLSASVANNPAQQILLSLLVSIGLPYFFLSTLSTLLQLWQQHLTGREPFQLYALSNVGGLLALVLYPVVFEQFFTLQTQAWIWTIGMVVLSCLVAGIAVAFQATASSKLPLKGKLSQSQKHSLTEKPLQEQSFKSKHQEPLVLPRKWWSWLLLAIASSSLLLVVTTQVSQEIATGPFLWLLPLGLYLSSYSLAFSSLFRYSRWMIGLLVALFLLPVMAAWSRFFFLPFSLQLLSWLGFLFATTLFLHAELFVHRPSKKSELTAFYLMISLGGVVSGLVISVLMPMLSSSYIETPIVLLLLCLVFGMLLQPTARQTLQKKLQEVAFAWSPLLMVLAVVSSTYFRSDGEILTQQRNFYGVVTVEERSVGDLRMRRLLHGGIAHGIQVQAPEYRGVPLAYYASESGLGAAVAAVRSQGQISEEAKESVGSVLSEVVANDQASSARGLRVALLGLGVGNAVGFCEDGDKFVLFEINPQVITIAVKYFEYLGHCREVGGKIQIVPGDARLQLAAYPTTTWQSDANLVTSFDLIVLDVFSDDAIPIHLLTEEALDLYFAQLQPKGVLAVHISNRHVDLKPVLHAYAEQRGIAAKVKYTKPTETPHLRFQSEWVLLSRELSELESIDAPLLGESTTRKVYWTDRFSNMLSVLR
jgi:spermidine synthase